MESMNKKITISDVAEALHISKTTVSRAISGNGRISEETRKKVLDYIKEKDYKPNSIAKSLAQSKTNNIAMVIPGDCDLVEMPFFQNSMQGICEEAFRQDYDVMLVTMKEGDLSNLIRVVDHHKVDGVILSRSFVKDKAAVLLLEKEVPFVLMGTSKQEEILQVDNNHEEACKELVVSMMEKGFSRIGLIGGNTDFVVNRARLKGFQKAYRQEKRTLEKELVFDNCETYTQVEKAVFTLYEQQTDCIVCMDDRICAQVLQALEKRKIKVPSQMKVASFYDSTLLKNHEPAITSLRFDDKALGRLTCSVLLDSIKGKPVKKKNLLGFEMVYRKSTEKERDHA